MYTCLRPPSSISAARDWSQLRYIEVETGSREAGNASKWSTLSDIDKEGRKVWWPAICTALTSDSWAPSTPAICRAIWLGFTSFLNTTMYESSMVSPDLDKGARVDLGVGVASAKGRRNARAWKRILVNSSDEDAAYRWMDGAVDTQVRHREQREMSEERDRVASDRTREDVEIER
jgi:hypothetical protein